MIQKDIQFRYQILCSKSKQLSFGINCSWASIDLLFVEKLLEQNLPKCTQSYGTRVNVSQRIVPFIYVELTIPYADQTGINESFCNINVLGGVKLFYCCLLINDCKEIFNFAFSFIFKKLLQTEFNCFFTFLHLSFYISSSIAVFFLNFVFLYFRYYYFYKSIYSRPKLCRLTNYLYVTQISYVHILYIRYMWFLKIDNFQSMFIVHFHKIKFQYKRYHVTYQKNKTNKKLKRRTKSANELYIRVFTYTFLTCNNFSVDHKVLKIVEDCPVRANIERYRSLQRHVS